jgi:hypothetical protein
MRSLLAAAAASILLAVPAFAQQPCLHGPDEDAVQKARRQAGLTMVRAINSTEATVRAMKGQFLPLADLRRNLINRGELRG